MSQQHWHVSKLEWQGYAKDKSKPVEVPGVKLGVQSAQTQLLVIAAEYARVDGFVVSHDTRFDSHENFGVITLMCPAADVREACCVELRMFACESKSCDA